MNNGKYGAVLQKIRKLLELARDPTNEHEAALAAARARQLLEEHNLTVMEVMEETKESGEKTIKLGRRLYSYQLSLLEAVRYLFDVEYGRLARRRGARAAFVLCGAPQNVEAAVLTFNYFLASIESLMAARPFIRGLSPRHSYRNGAGKRIEEEARALKHKAVKGEQCQALIHIGRAIARKHISENYKDKGQTRARFSSRDTLAWKLGFIDGERVNLHGTGKHLAGEFARHGHARKLKEE